MSNGISYMPNQQTMNPAGYGLGSGLGEAIMQMLQQKQQQKQWNLLTAALSGQPISRTMGGINLPLLGNIGGKQVSYPATEGPNWAALGSITNPEMQKLAMSLFAQQFQQPEPLQPTQQIAQEKLNLIKQLQAKVQAGTATEKETTALDKMLVGESLVNLDIALKPPPSEMLQQLGGLYELQAKTDMIAELIDPDVIGQLKGRWAEFRSNWSELPFVEEPTTNQIVFQQITEMMADDLLRLKSGAQINEKEYERLRKLLPDPKTSENTFRSKLKGFQAAVNITINSKKRILEETGYIVPGKTAPVETISATNPNTGQRIISNDGGKTWQPIK